MTSVRPSTPRARGLAGRAIRRLARPVLLGQGSPIQQLRDRLGQLEEVLEHQSAAVHDLALAARRFDEVLQKAIPRLEQATIERDGTVAEIVRALEVVRTRIEVIEPAADFARRAQSLPFMSEPFTSFEQDGRTVLGFEHGAERNDVYRAFEDLFRGSEERIRDLQRVYEDVIGRREPVLDFGCGRGEFLDLLAEWGLERLGVDADEGMVARCHEKGHEGVVAGDGLAFLEAREDASLGAVFSAQVIEHLPFGVLERLLAVSRQKLRPDGLFIAETVNPHAPDALKGFWLDPTHQHPLFPEVMLALARIAGFDSAYVFAPSGTGDFERDRTTEPAYALVARRGP